MRKQIKTMYTLKDIEARTIIMLNCIDSDKKLRVSNGEFFLEKFEEGKSQTLTKFPFQKLLAVFVIGDITVTTPLIDKCKKFNVSFISLKANLRPTFFWSNAAEGNYLLRKKQYYMLKEDISYAKILVKNKIKNQLYNLIKTRRKDELTEKAKFDCKAALDTIDDIQLYEQLMGVEGVVSKSFFSAYFQELDWKCRRPRMKCDIINTALDIGYSMLFNLLESFIRIFGFDVYIGVYHQAWFKRKSLVCDLIEPFRCIVDHTVLLGFKRKQFKKEDFILDKAEWRLKREKSYEYYTVFINSFITYKKEMFKYVQAYYRFFMNRHSVPYQPEFIFT